MTERPIIVTKHAVDAYRRRLNDDRPYPALVWEIEECVRSAIQSGLMFDHRPEGFVLYRRKKDSLPPGQRFVQCDKESNFGFVIKRTTDEGDIVMTTLTRAGVRR